jgi:hypothetical protein
VCRDAKKLTGFLSCFATGADSGAAGCRGRDARIDTGEFGASVDGGTGDIIFSGIFSAVFDDSSVVFGELMSEDEC